MKKFFTEKGKDKCREITLNRKKKEKNVKKEI